MSLGPITTHLGPSVFRFFFQGKFRFSKWLFPFFPENSVFSQFFKSFPVSNKIYFTVFSRKFLFFRIYESRIEYLVVYNRLWVNKHGGDMPT